MLEIDQQHAPPELAALFDPHAPARLRCFAVLDGTSRGRVFVDNRDRPAWGAVQEGAFGTLYFGGAPHAPASTSSSPRCAMMAMCWLASGTAT